MVKEGVRERERVVFVEVLEDECVYMCVSACASVSVQADELHASACVGFEAVARQSPRRVELTKLDRDFRSERSTVEKLIKTWII